MNANSAYREWPPPPAWQATVACLWEQRVTTDYEHRVVPDGCADVIVAVGGTTAVGLADGPALHPLTAGSACRGLRLHPEAVATFFGVPAVELRNLEVPLEDVLGTARTRHLVDIVLHGGADGTLTSAPPDKVRAAVGLLRTASVDDSAAALGVSPRQLRRLLLEHTGLGPKSFQRVARLCRFLDDDGPLARAAVNAGYADQPHLTREVTRLCGLPPAQLRAQLAAG